MNAPTGSPLQFFVPNQKINNKKKEENPNSVQSSETIRS